MKKLFLLLILMGAALLCAGCIADSGIEIVATINGQALDPQVAYEFDAEEGIVHIHVNAKRQIKEIQTYTSYGENDMGWTPFTTGSWKEMDFDEYISECWEDTEETLHLRVVLPDDSIALETSYRFHHVPRCAFDHEDYWGDVAITGYHGNVETVEVPAEIDGKRVVRIAAEAFSNHLYVSKIILPDSIRSIGERAFLNTWMNEIVLPDPIEEISAGAFEDCARLKAVSWPACADEVPDYAFAGCEDLASVTLPPSVQTIGKNAFSHCDSLSHIDLPQSLLHLGAHAFRTCPLTSIEFPDSLESIGERCFEMCEALEAVQLPAHLRRLEIGAFSRCRSLYQVSLPDSLVDIQDNPFPACPSLERIILSENHPILKMKDGVLYNTLEDILLYFPVQDMRVSFTVPDGIRRIGSCAFSSNRIFSSDPALSERLAEILLPDTMEELGAAAFQGCNFTEITLPDGLRFIGECAFAPTLEHLEMPDSVTELGIQTFLMYDQLKSIKLSDSLVVLPSAAFFGCTALREIILPRSLRNIGQYCFNGCSNLQDIYVQDHLEYIAPSSMPKPERAQLMIFTHEDDLYTINYCIKNDILLKVESRP